MRVLFISEYYPPKIKGGGEINLKMVATALAKRQVEVAVLTSHFPGLLRYEEREEVKIYRRLRTGENPSSLRSNLIRSVLFPHSVRQEAKKLVTEIHPDRIHFLGTSVMGAATLRKSGIPLFATIESYPALCPKGDRWYREKEECNIQCSFSSFIRCQRYCGETGKMKNHWYLKYNLLFLLYTYRHYTRLHRALSSCTRIAISAYVQRLLQLHGLSSTVLPNMVDAAPFTLARNRPKNQSKKLKALYLGSLIKSKGPQILLQALPGIDCRCDLYGEGTIKNELQRIINENHLDAEIHSPAPYENVPQLYAEADIVVFPSLWPEPFGRIPLEARAAGKIIIASNTGAIPETVWPENGILVSPGNVEELRRAIIKSIEKSAPPLQPTSLFPYSGAEVGRKIINLYHGHY